MSVSFSDILLNYAASVFTDDIRWKEELANDAALFLRLKSLYVHSGIARFNRPSGMQEYLAYTDCTYDDFYYTAPTALTPPFTVQTGKTNFALQNVGLVGLDKFNNPYYTPITGFTYDAETGDIEITALPSGVTIAQGQVIQFDFYTDGVFTNELSQRVQSILGQCIAYEWFCNLSSNYLSIVPKVQDSSFTIKSENEWMRVTTERRRLMLQELNAALLKYEQDCFFAGVVPVTQRINPI